MGSSGSTPSPRDRPPIRRWVRIIGNDHPRACTGRRLLRLGLVQEFTGGTNPSDSPVVLDPYALEPLSGADLPSAERGGILAVDCSWNALAETGRLPGAGPSRDLRHRRRLPFLIATNPQHYGRLGELNTVEALGAALYVLGRPREADAVLRGFAGGAAFLEVNHERLDQFARAGTADGVRQAERAIYGGGRTATRSSAPGTQSRASRRRRSRLPGSSEAPP